MAEAFNHRFANVGHDLAKGISRGANKPEYYLNPTNKTFSFNSCSVITRKSGQYAVQDA